MDFYKSTSSNHSHNSNSSHSNGGNTYNLEYFTSSSSLSPFSCPSSAAKSFAGVGDGACDSASPSPLVGGSAGVVLPTSISGVSAVPAATVSSSTSVASLGAVASTSSNVVYSSQSAQLNRKRRRSSVITDKDNKDPEICFEPSAKRQQRLPSLYHSESSSVVSSVYPSPDELVHEIDTQSSDCLSTASGYDVRCVDDIPESPNSLLHADDECLPDDDDADDDGDDDDTADDDDECDVTDDEDDEIVSGTTSPSASSVASSKISLRCDEPTLAQLEAAEQYINNQQSHHHQQQQQQQTHHGERTPGQRHSMATTLIVTAPVSERKVKSFDDYVGSHYSCMTPASDPEPLRQCPLPALSWANADDVWQLMCKKDEQASCLRDPGMLEQHPGLQPRMRAILLDWLIEVCEVYKLHRETYYLTIDYLDRYLSTQKKVQKTHLQLIGITCLFVAAKVEEIYPPKIGEFAYVTDGACQEADILQHEILLLQALEWNISPVTPMGWLGVYMQLNVNNRTPASLIQTAEQQRKLSSAGVDDAFIYPQFSGMQFVQTAQLLDLCSLDVAIANFPYSVLAAAAISHTFNRETALRCSGLDWQTIKPCARWMQPFFEVVREEANFLHLMEQGDQVASKFGLGHVCPNIVTDDSHIIQTHTITLDMFDRACNLQDQLIAIARKIKQEASPATGLMCSDGILTPPGSIRKPLGGFEEPAHMPSKTTLPSVGGGSTFLLPASAITRNVENCESIAGAVSSSSRSCSGTAARPQ